MLGLKKEVQTTAPKIGEIRVDIGVLLLVKGICFYRRFLNTCDPFLPTMFIADYSKRAKCSNEKMLHFKKGRLTTLCKNVGHVFGLCRQV